MLPLHHFGTVHTKKGIYIPMQLWPSYLTKSITLHIHFNVEQIFCLIAYLKGTCKFQLEQKWHKCENRNYNSYGDSNDPSKILDTIEINFCWLSKDRNGTVVRHRKRNCNRHPFQFPVAHEKFLLRLLLRISDSIVDTNSTG